MSMILSSVLVMPPWLRIVSRLGLVGGLLLLLGVPGHAAPLDDSHVCCYHTGMPHGTLHYRLQRTGDLVDAVFTARHLPVADGAPYLSANGAPYLSRVLFTIPPEFRPPNTVVRVAEGQLVTPEGQPVSDPPLRRRFRLRVASDGVVSHMLEDSVEDRGFLAYTLHTVWGTTRAASDRAVLELLDAAWFGDPDLTALSPALASGVRFRPDGRVTSLNMNGKHFSGAGTIPPEIGQLEVLTSLEMAWESSASGPIPPELGHLRYLRFLDLSRSRLAGDIPAELGHLRRLAYLDLSRSGLTGEIPAELSRLPNLRILRLHGNILSGGIPATLGQLPHLTTLDLSSNRLTGPIPPALGQLDTLEHLDLSDNELTGRIPPALGQLAALEYLNLSANKLRSRIPPALGQLAQLQYLYLSGNLKRRHEFYQFTGIIPPALGQLVRLRELDLSTNSLRGPIPPELGQLRQLRRLLLQDNRLSAVPRELGQLTNLSILDLRANSLTGCLPLPAAWQATAWQKGPTVLSSDNPGTITDEVYVRSIPIPSPPLSFCPD